MHGRAGQQLLVADDALLESAQLLQCYGARERGGGIVRAKSEGLVGGREGTGRVAQGAERPRQVQGSGRRVGTKCQGLPQRGNRDVPLPAVERQRSAQFP